MNLFRWTLTLTLMVAIGCGDDDGGSTDSGATRDSGVTPDSGVTSDSGVTPDSGVTRDSGSPSDGGTRAVTADDVNAARRAQTEALCGCIFADVGYDSAAACVAGEEASAEEEACFSAGFAAADVQEFFACQVEALEAFVTCAEAAACDDAMLTACDDTLSAATDACPEPSEAEAAAFQSALDACAAEMVVGPAGSCPDSADTTSATGSMVFTGSTMLKGDDAEGSCGDTGGADVQLQWTAPSSGTFTIDTFGSGFDTVLYVLDGCDGTELSCNDDSGESLQSEVTIDATEGTEYIIVVDGWEAIDAGDYVVNITPPAT